MNLKDYKDYFYVEIILGIVGVAFAQWLTSKVFDSKSDSNPETIRSFSNNIRIMPEWSFTGLYGDHISASQLSSEKHCIILLMDSQSQSALTIIQRINADSSVRSNFTVLCVSMEDHTTLRQYRNTLGLNLPASFLFVADTAYTFDDLFGTATVPSVYCYNKEHILQFSGTRVNPDTLIFQMHKIIHDGYYNSKPEQKIR